MHEVGLAEDLMDLVDRLRQEHGAERVVSVRVQVGALSGVEAECLQSAWQMLVTGRSNWPSELDLEYQPILAQCQDCRTETKIEPFRFLCPQCGGSRLEVIAGESLLLRDVTLE